MSDADTSALHQENAAKSLKLASTLFPGEEWMPHSENIFVAKSRLSEKFKEPEKWEREMSQVRILTDRRSVAYFLPEVEKKGITKKLCADLVLDGIVMEIKTLSGTRETLGMQFKTGYKQGFAALEKYTGTREHSVFIRLISDLSVASVKAKIAGELKKRYDPGSFICYFENTGELHSWTYKELRAIIGKKA
jgi:hypothetical protein